MNRDLSMFIDSLLIGTIVVIWLLIITSVSIKLKDYYQNKK